MEGAVGPEGERPFRMLVLCTGNSARSQMAEAIVRKLAGDAVEVHSAGIAPAGLNPLAVQAMAEIGVDISGQRSKSVTEFLGQRFDLVLTVCDSARESCPVFPGAPEYVHWSLPDPAAATGSHEARMQVFREVRDRLQGLLGDLLRSRGLVA
ncbi:MAG: arsenate reductase ArsC [Anaerolineae bacterium]|nr:arsenate reductase ArsC [Anaerolineae bacterium]